MGGLLLFCDCGIRFDGFTEDEWKDGKMKKCMGGWFCLWGQIWLCTEGGCTT
jgi:hypothetical protein